MIEKISKSLGLLTIIVIYLGYCNLSSYYDYFGIDISSYLSSSEIILSFVPVINELTMPLSFILTFILLLNLFTFFTPEKNHNRHGSYKHYFDNNFWNRLNFKTKLKVFFSANRESVIFLPILLIFTIKGCKEIDTITINGVISGPTIVFTPIFFLFILLFKDSISYLIPFLKPYRNILFIIATFIWLLFITSTNNEIHAKRIMNGIPDKDIEFQYNKECLKTDSNLLYIGRTQQYTFLYQVDKKSAMPYLNKKIENIKIKDKRTYKTNIFEKIPIQPDLPPFHPIK